MVSTTTIIWAAMSIILLTMLLQQDKENIKLSAENGVMKGRVEGMRETMAASVRQSMSPLDFLTKDGIVEAVRQSGYVPEVSGDWISFKAGEKKYLIDTAKHSQAIIQRRFNLGNDICDLGILKQAAFYYSNDTLLAKAVVNGIEGNDGNDGNDGNAVLIILIPAVDRNYHSFYENLSTYLDTIDNGLSRMAELYNHLEAERQNALPASQIGNSIIS